VAKPGRVLAPPWRALPEGRTDTGPAQKMPSRPAPLRPPSLRPSLRAAWMDAPQPRAARPPFPASSSAPWEFQKLSCDRDQLL